MGNKDASEFIKFDLLLPLGSFLLSFILLTKFKLLTESNPPYQIYTLKNATIILDRVFSCTKSSVHKNQNSYIINMTYHQQVPF